MLIVERFKDLARLEYRSQLRDLVAYAQSRGVPLEIFTNGRLPQSGALAGLMQRGDVIISPIP